MIVTMFAWSYHVKMLIPIIKKKKNLKIVILHGKLDNILGYISKKTDYNNLVYLKCNLLPFYSTGIFHSLLLWINIILNFKVLMLMF